MAKTQKGASCKQCCQTLKLEPDSHSLDRPLSSEMEAITDEEIQLRDWVRFYEYSQPAIKAKSEGSGTKCFDYACRVLDEPDGGGGVFMCVTDSSCGSEMEIKAALSDITSDASDLSHPLCEDCANKVSRMMDEVIEEAENDVHSYSIYLNRLNREDLNFKYEEPETELAICELEEAQLLEILTFENEILAGLEKSIAEQETTYQSLSKKEEHCFRQIAVYDHDFMDMVDQEESAQKVTTYTTSRLNRLKESNILNNTFAMVTAGNMGKINNLRLATIPDAKVIQCSEVNAAWGQISLLLSGLARKMNLTFDEYELVPYGSRSHIKVLSQNKILPLFTSRGNRYGWNIPYDLAMKAFLHCLEQLYLKIVQDEYSNFKLPYPIVNGKIINPATLLCYSIGTMFSSDEDWTTAMKMMLTDMEWCLVAVSSFGRGAHSLNVRSTAAQNAVPLGE